VVVAGDDYGEALASVHVVGLLGLLRAPGGGGPPRAPDPRPRRDSRAGASPPPAVCARLGLRGSPRRPPATRRAGLRGLRPRGRRLSRCRLWRRVATAGGERGAGGG